jgi:hypothetical protein
MATTVAAARPSARWRGNRKRRNASGENQPGHRKFSFRTGKTVRSLHRSNA